MNSQQAEQPGWLSCHSQAPQALNTCKEVIRCAPLVNCDKEEILRELNPQWVKDIFNITVRVDSDTNRNNYTFIVTFNTSVIPKHITIGYIRLPASVYIPNPLRCFKCQKYGHGKNSCRERETCSTCGQIGHTNSIALVSPSVRTALAGTLPSACTARNGCLKKEFSK